ncbi:VOC family protein [Nocardioides sp. GXQ0305]
MTHVHHANGYILPGGRRFHFADPNGNELGLWSSA